MFTFKIGHTTVHIWPFIIVLFITILGFFISIRFVYRRSKKIVTFCREGEYEKSISLASKQLHYYQRLLKKDILGKSGKRNANSMIENLSIYLAISHLGLSDDEQFIQNMDRVNDENSAKHFWLALFYLIKNNFTDFQTHFDILSSENVSSDSLSYLTSIKTLKECNHDPDARDVLSALYSKLDFKLLKDISEKIMNH